VSNEDAKKLITASIDRRVSLVLTDGDSFVAVPLTVDDEGFVYAVEGKAETNPFWTRFEAVVSINPAMQP
jgi:hypothetical protein